MSDHTTTTTTTAAASPDATGSHPAPSSPLTVTSTTPLYAGEQVSGTYTGSDAQAIDAITALLTSRYFGGREVRVANGVFSFIGYTD